MYRFDIITIFPEAFESYFNLSIIKRAQDKKLIRIYLHNLRKWTSDKHQSVDDRPFGGGAGMIFKLLPVFKAVKDIKKLSHQPRKRVIVFSPKGKTLTQAKVRSLLRYKHIVFITPRYEGVDERIIKHVADETISIGDYILTGGELPAMVVIDAMTRLIPGVIKERSLKEESFSGKIRYEYPQYTRPAIFYPDPRNHRKAWRVPKVLLSGDHKKIEEWKTKHQESRI